MSDITMRSMLGSADYGEELGALLLERRRREACGGDRDKDLSMYRSGSAPPTVEGSLSAVGELYGDAAGVLGKGVVTDEELRSDPAYISYYYANVNLNPRLPPPLLSKEEVRFAQRLQGGGGVGGGGGGVLGGIGDRRKMSGAGHGHGNDDAGNPTSSLLFSVKQREENGVEPRKAAEWGGDGLIGLPGLGLGSRQKSLAEIIQDDLSQAKSVSRNPSRPPSRNAFDDNVETTEAQFAQLHHELESMDGLRSGATIQGRSSIQNIGSSASHTYASALGASLSRSTTPDPQLVARAPSPRIAPVGGGRNISMDQRGINGPNSFHNSASAMNESADLASVLSGMTLSTNGKMHDDTLVDDHQNLFNLQGGQNHIKQHPYLNKSDPVHFNINSVFQPAKGSSGNSLKASSAPSLSNGVSSSARYANVDATNSSYSNYRLSGYAFSPSSPPMMGNHIGNSNLPPLFEHVAAASAMGVSGMDSRTLGGNLSMRPNLMAAAVEHQNLSRMGNQTGGMPLLDPLYLQYLRSTEYAAAQVGALNDPTLDREYMSSYMDLLQKAYLGSSISTQKSQYDVPYVGKYASLNQGYYGSPGLGLGMSYPGSPSAGPLLPNSPVGPGSPARHGERNLRFSSGVRNFAGAMIGGWHSEAGGNFNESFASSLLDEFKSNKTKCFELFEIDGHVVEFSADQYGSRFIQQKLETATVEEKNMVFREIMPHALSLMTDVFGNYVVQKFFEHGSASQIRELADQLTGHVLNLSLQMYGCRVIQKAIEVVDLDQQTKMVAELDGHIMRCVRDQNGNHVIQKCIERIPEDAIQFIVSTFYDQVVMLSTHPYGCRVIQRVLEYCNDPNTQSIMMDEILKSVCMLAQDQYGNYVVQHVLEHGKPHERTAIITKLTGQIVQMSQQKFASNVIEKCLTFGDPVERQTLVDEMLGSTDENEPLQVMMKDQFANYVVQKVLETCNDQQLELILNRIKVHLNALKKYTYGKHIVARVEKLVAAGERRIGVLSLNAAA